MTLTIFFSLEIHNRMLYNIDNDNGSNVLQEKFKYTIGTIRSRKSEKHIKCNGEKKKKNKDKQ